MGWRHPDISFEELMRLIKGFVDILILASGFQSSGHFAHWDHLNIKKAFQWGLFFENVLTTLSSLDACEDSIKELDAALSKMTSATSFPQGLMHLSSATLAKGRWFMLEHLIHTLPLRDAHLRALLMVTVEMDIDELSGTVCNHLDVYLNNLKPQKIYPDVALVSENGKGTVNSFTKYTVQELLKRWSAVSGISTIGKGINIVSDSIKCSSWSEFAENLFEKQLKPHDSPLIVEWLIGFVTWNHWKSKSLSYFLDKRVVRMVSGASMIFSAPKVQWVEVFNRLNISSYSVGDEMTETIELLLLGCIASRWSNLIEHLMSVSYNSLTISEQYREVRNIVTGRFQTSNSKEETMCAKVNDILAYLTGLLGSQLHHLWKIPPILAAVAISSWSLLFKLYLSELETQFRGDPSTTSCCSCCQEKKEHYDFFMSVVPVNFVVAVVLDGLPRLTRRSKMKATSISSLWRIQFTKFGKRSGSSGSMVTLVRVQRRVSSGCCRGSYVLKKLAWKCKSHWKQAMRKQRNTAQYSYDLHSYSLNFDDGLGDF